MADNRKIAETVLSAVGGAGNVTSVTHCMTRLRFNLKDESIPRDEEVKKLSGVLGVARSGGQYQVIIGQNVPKVYQEVLSMGSFQSAAPVNENLDKSKEKLTPKKLGMNILNYLAGSLTPLIPILIGAAMFKTLLSILGPDMLKLFRAESDLYKLFDFVYDAGFYFLPIFIGYTAASKIGASPILGMESMKPDYDPFASLKNCIEHAHSEGVEMFVCHPGYLDAYILEKSSLTTPRAMEVKMCCSEETKQFLTENEVKLVTYCDLK